MMIVRHPSIYLCPVFVLLAIESLAFFSQGLIVSDQLTAAKNKGLHRINTIKMPGDGVFLPKLVGFQLCLAQGSDAKQNNDESSDGDGASSAIEEELEQLNNQLSLIEAIEARNESQLDSFIDEEDQWNSLEEEERNLLESKDFIIQRLELLTEQMIQLWMGQKSMEG